MTNDATPDALVDAVTHAPPEATPAPRRRGRPRGSTTRLMHEAAGLGRHHFAFVRAVLQGVDLRRAWERYLAFSGGPDDARHFASRLREICAVIRDAAQARAMHRQAAAALAPLRRRPELRAAASIGRQVTQQVRGQGGAGSGGVATLDLSSPAPPRPALAPPAPPTLDDWIARRCAEAGIDEDFHTQAEWLELYREEFGTGADGMVAPSPRPPAAPSALPARSALSALSALEAQDGGAGEPGAHDDRDGDVVRDAAAPSPAERGALKQALAALAELDAAIAREPRLDDPTAHWLGAGLPPRLARVGVRTLRDLVDLMNVHGFRWHRHVERLGAVRARRLAEWLAPVAERHGHPLREHARRPSTDLALLRAQQLARRPAAPRFDLVPIDALAVPPALSGRDGEFRAEGANIWGAQTDLEAVVQWLARYHGRTLEDYTRIAERFVLWCLHVRRKALSSLTEADVREYRAFLESPPPEWVQPRKVRRTDPAWRPFRGGLCPSAQRREFTVLGSMFATMLDKGYLRANALADAPKYLRLGKPTIDVRRSLDDRQWAFAMQVLAERPDTPQRRRLQLVLELGSTTGLRLAELTTARLRGLRRERVDGEDAWVLDVVGKGGKPRTVVVFDDVKALIDAHQADMERAGVGLDPEVTLVRTVQAPARTAPPSPAPAAPGAPPPGRVGDELAEIARRSRDDGLRPLIGALRRPPPQRRLDELGLPVRDEVGRHADRYGALERSALYQSLRRFFRDVAREAARREDAPDAGEFLRVSTHWLRHTFANGAIRHMPPQVVQALMGHADLRVTSVYVKAGAEDLVRGMRSMRRAPATAR